MIGQESMNGQQRFIISTRGKMMNYVSGVEHLTGT